MSLLHGWWPAPRLVDPLTLYLAEKAMEEAEAALARQPGPTSSPAPAAEDPTTLPPEGSTQSS